MKQIYELLFYTISPLSNCIIPVLKELLKIHRAWSLNKCINRRITIYLTYICMWDNTAIDNLFNQCQWVSFSYQQTHISTFLQLPHRISLFLPFKTMFSSGPISTILRKLASGICHQLASFLNINLHIVQTRFPFCTG